MNEFDSLHLVMFSGKGGVGKTTLSCGFARRWAKQFPGDRIRLISTDPAHSLGDVLQLPVSEDATAMADLPNLQVQALDAEQLLAEFKARYGQVLEALVERGSFVEGSDLTPVWDLGWPGLDELMSILEIQRLFREQEVDRVVVDMAPSGHTIHLFELMDFLDQFLASLDLFQQKHRTICESLAGRYNEDDADDFLSEMRSRLEAGRELLQDHSRTACLAVAIAEPMSLQETRRFLDALDALKIPVGGIFVNHVLTQVTDTASSNQWEKLAEQQQILSQFQTLPGQHPLFVLAEQEQEPVGAIALDSLIPQLTTVKEIQAIAIDPSKLVNQIPEKILPSFTNFIAEDRHLIIVGGKGGVGKTTVAAAIAWGMAEQHGERQVRVISIDPAHSLGDALDEPLGHDPTQLTANLSAQEVNADILLDQFREDYLWELAEIMSGEIKDEQMKLLYGPQAWRQIVSQALPGIDEMLSLITVMELLEAGDQDLIILDTAPTGHLLRFLEMPTAMADWLAWIFRLWMKYQDVVGRTAFIGRLRSLRKRVVDAQKKLKDPSYTEFIGVLQAQSAIVAEAERLSQSLSEKEVSQRYVVHNCFEPTYPLQSSVFDDHTVVRLPRLPRAIAPREQVKVASSLLF